MSLGRPTSEATIDVYERYWAHRMQRHASVRDVLEWLIVTSDGARRFYNENTELAASIAIWKWGPSIGTTGSSWPGICGRRDRFHGSSDWAWWVEEPSGCPLSVYPAHSPAWSAR